MEGETEPQGRPRRGKGRFLPESECGMGEKTQGKGFIVRYPGKPKKNRGWSVRENRRRGGEAEIPVVGEAKQESERGSGRESERYLVEEAKDRQKVRQG